MRNRSLLFLLLLAACSDAKPKEVALSDALPNIPVPPGGAVVSRELGEEAVKVRFSSPITPDEVARYYRELLSKAPYTLVSDTRTADSAITLYAEQPGQPSLWVAITPAGRYGTFVDIAGAKERPKRQ
jgi:hypothetical protein